MPTDENGTAGPDADGAGGRPNVVVVLADDLGYSDLGCYGGEIRTPSLDRLAEHGVRLSTFYNTARCSPSRASLLTGLHPHQTGIGILTNDDRPEGYPGSLNGRCVTAAEVLREAGYATCLSGKWHLSSQMRTPGPAWPTRRGFQDFFGTITGCGSYYNPGTLTRGETNVEAEADRPGFYYTDAITDHAVDFIRTHRANSPDEPFFLYTAYTAPHWPLHAPEAAVTAYDGVFDEGWDILRERRLERLVSAGILEPGTKLSHRDPSQPAWHDVENREWQLRRMQVYAAQVELMDAGVGRLLDTLAETGCVDDTLVLFLSDNGASPEDLPLVELERFRQRTDIVRQATRDGRPVTIGNDPAVPPGGEDTYASYGQAWANLSNTPFRRYKKWVHEGGIAAPFIASWPAAGLGGGSVVHQPFQLTDVLPTILEATGADYPRAYRGRDVLSLEGRSMLGVLHGQEYREHDLFWEHVGNAAIRRGRWKLVREYDDPWELYDVVSDRTELDDLAAERPDVVEELASAHAAWSARVGVIPFDRTLQRYQRHGLTPADAAG